MIDGLKPYRKYKGSGLPWLQEVPKHWEVRRGKALFRCIDVRSRTGQEELLTVSSERGVVPRRSANVTMFKAESYVGYKLCWPDDLVINSLWAWARGLGVSPYHGIVSSAYGVYRLRNRQQDNPRFIHQLVRSTPFQWELQVRSKGIWVSRLQLTDDAFLGAPFPMPPSDEQTAIVRFLDWADRRIRRVIRLRKKRIKLLEEYKQVLINQAVTGKIDVHTGKPYPKYKHSGVEWLGEVPEYWEVRRLKTLCSMKSGDAITNESIDPTGDCPVYGGNGIRGYTSRYTHVGDFVLVGRQGALCGNVHIARGHFWASEHAVVATLRGNHLIEWFAALLATMNLNQYSIAAAQPGLAVERIVNLHALVPPLPEQTAIVEFLDEQTARIDAAIASDRRVIDLLKEFRTRLVADVVTGKLDVREAAEKLPDEPPEEEGLEQSDAKDVSDRSGLPDETESVVEEVS